MIPCSSCSCHIQRWELRCPHCGVARAITFDPARAAKLTLIALGALGLSACGSGSAGGSEEGMTVTTSPGSATTDGSEATSVISTSTGEDTSTESGMMTFVPDRDFAALYGECDPFSQDCPEGEKCVPYAPTGSHLGANKCVMIEGDTPPGQPCISDGLGEASDSCDGDSYCWNTEEIDGEHQGVCAGFCAGAPDNPMCPEGQVCLISNDGALSVCVDSCDPLAQDCANDWTCHVQLGQTLLGCWEGELGEGEACVGGEHLYDDCGPGLTCVGAQWLPMCAGERCCTGICDLANPSCTLPGTTCALPWMESLPGHDDLGICIVP